MTRKIAFLVWLAQITLARHRTEDGAFVAVSMKRWGHKTDAGAYYVVGGRGIYRFIHAAWDRLTALGLHAEADAVARAFTKANGQYAYR